MIAIIPKKNSCWWCGNIANSSEHKHKKTDVVRVFGDEIPNKNVVRLGDGKIIQGPNSSLFKFEKVICHTCNTAKSQPFDLAYDQFIEGIEATRDYLIENKEIDFLSIFPQNTLENKLNVIRYYVKHICCRLASNNISIEPAIIDFLNGNNSLKYLYLKFEIRIDLIAWIERLKKSTGKDPGNLYVGSLFSQTEQDNDSIELIYSFYTYRWFRIIYFYSLALTENNYPGYDIYNKNLKTEVQSLYLIHPSKYESLTDEELLAELNKTEEGFKDDKFPEHYLQLNPFKTKN